MHNSSNQLHQLCCLWHHWQGRQ